MRDFGGKIEWNGDQAEMQVENSKGANLKHRLKVESRRHAIEQLLNSLWTGDTLPFKYLMRAARASGPAVKSPCGEYS